MTDINDLNVAEEPLTGFDPEAELYKAPVPPDDAKYTVVLEQQPQFGTDLFWRDHPATEKGGAYRSTKVIGRISESASKFDGRLVFGDFISTMIRNGSSTVAQIIKALGYGEKLAQCQNHGDLCNLFDQAISIGSPIKTTTRWKLPYSSKVSKDELNRYNGQSSFPAGPVAGTFDPTVQFFVTNPETQEEEVIELTARAVMVAYYPLSESTGGVSRFAGGGGLSPVPAATAGY